MAAWGWQQVRVGTFEDSGYSHGPGDYLSGSCSKPGSESSHVPGASGEKVPSVSRKPIDMARDFSITSWATVLQRDM